MVADARDKMLLIQFAKAPVPGEVKTRMMPALSALQACELHQELLLWTCRQLCAARVGTVELWVSGDPDHSVFRQCVRHGVARIQQQAGADLGERMAGAMADGLARYEQVILVGSDCPSIDRRYLQLAAAALAAHSVVLGPADDGGYVLIGANEVKPELFRGIAWGKSGVFAETVALLERHRVNWTALDFLPDIDRPGDLPIWRALNTPESLSL
jgi:rSAM/selenodomain-associated transferase 1